MLWGTFTLAHFITLVLAAGMLAGLYFLLRRKSQKAQTAVLGVLSFLGIAAIIYELVAKNAPLANLPLHLCSINIIFIAIHAWKPGKMLDNFLYGICIPGAVAALLCCKSLCTRAMSYPLFL